MNSSKKMDLHIHSKYSDKLTNQFFRRFNIPECHTDPEYIYKKLKTNGMDYVTITDHNEIGGCLELLEKGYNNVVIGSEITVRFPENNCKIHVPVWNITEEQHRELQKIKRDVYEFLQYVKEHGIPHTLAHPLYSVNDSLDMDTFEKLLVLFKHYELNGCRDIEQNNCIKKIVKLASEEMIEKFCKKHSIVPVFEDSHIKHFTAGSDDHSAAGISKMYTSVPVANSPEEFFEQVKNGNTQVHGMGSSPLTLSYNLYSIGYRFYKKNFNLERIIKSDENFVFLDFILSPERHGDTSTARRSRISGFFNMIANRYPGMTRKPIFRLRDQASLFISTLIRKNPQYDFRRRKSLNTDDVDNLWHDIFSGMIDKCLANSYKDILSSINEMNIGSIVPNLSSTALLYFLTSPYVISHSVFARDRKFGHSVLENLTNEKQIEKKVAVFTDTLLETNGVANTLSKQIEYAEENKINLVTLVSYPEEIFRKKLGERKSVVNFDPCFSIDTGYKDLFLYVPSFFHILNYCFRENVTSIHVSTPGPLGIMGVLVANILDIPVSTTQHTSFPEYVRSVTDSVYFSKITGSIMSWFYSRMDKVFVRSNSCAKSIIELGVNEKKIFMYPKLVDRKRFHENLGKYELLEQLDSKKILYVGRVSKEKGIEVLVKSFKKLAKRRKDIYLVIVGDGPYLEEMRSKLRDLPVLFTGFIDHDDPALGKIYNSCDLFVFPSTTDTYGNVVIEAQSCGLPCIVSDAGGAKENIVEGKTGLLFKSNDERDLSDKIEIALDLANMKSSDCVGHITGNYSGEFYENLFDEY